MEAEILGSMYPEGKTDSAIFIVRAKGKVWAGKMETIKPPYVASEILARFK